MLYIKGVLFSKRIYINIVKFNNFFYSLIIINYYKLQNIERLK